MMQDHTKVFNAFRRAWLPNLSSYINAPIKDKGTLSSLQKRAASFEFQGTSLASALIPDLTFDIGSLILNKQLFVSAIDLESSKELLLFASRKFGYDATTKNTGAGLLIERSFEAAISRQFGKPAHSHFEAIILVRTDEDHIVWPSIVTAGAIGSLAPISPETKFPAKLVRQYAEIIPPATTMLRGLNDRLVAWNGKQWGLAEFSASGGGIILKQPAAAYPGVDTFKMSRLGKFQAVDDVQRYLRIGIQSAYLEYHDKASGLMLPGESPCCGSSGMSNWIKKMDNGPAVMQTIGGDSGGGGGGGGGSHVDTSVQYGGTGVCLGSHTSHDACISCCENQALAATGVMLTTTVAATIASSPSLLGAILVFAVGMIVTVAVAGFSVYVCEKACNAPIRGTGAGGGT